MSASAASGVAFERIVMRTSTRARRCSNSAARARSPPTASRARGTDSNSMLQVFPANAPGSRPTALGIGQHHAVAGPDASFERAVLAVLGRLGPGDLVTYGEVAEEAGFPGAAR